MCFCLDCTREKAKTASHAASASCCGGMGLYKRTRSLRSLAMVARDWLCSRRKGRFNNKMVGLHMDKTRYAACDVLKDIAVAL